MFVHRRDVQIQWGDCDPANIVYYPRYFAMFDDSTSIMFEAAGFSKQDIVKKYGLVGIPMVDTRAKFHIDLDPWRLDHDRKPDRKLQAIELRGHPQGVQGRGAGDRGIRNPGAGWASPRRSLAAEIGADAAGDYRAIHAGLT
jgi:hypothetical protein